MSKGYTRSRLEQGDMIRVCPACLSPLVWWEYRKPITKALPDGVQITEEKARCDNHGWVDWWRIVQRSKADRVTGFSTFLRGGRLHRRPVEKVRVLAHVERRLPPFKRKPNTAKLKKLRNRFRGRLVKDVRQTEMVYE